MNLKSVKNSKIEVVAGQILAKVEVGESHEELAGNFLGLWGRYSSQEREELLVGENVVKSAAEYLEVAYGDPFSELADRLFLAGLRIKDLIAEIQAHLSRNEVPQAEDVRRLQNLARCLALATSHAQAMGRKAGMSLKAARGLER